MIIVDCALPVIRYLYGFEEYCRSACITFRTIHHNNPRPLTSQRQVGAEYKEPSMTPERMESVDHKMEEVGPEIRREKEDVKERQTSPRVRCRIKPTDQFVLNVSD